MRPELAQGRFVVFDIETTGGNPTRNGITEIFAIKFNGKKTGETFYSLVDPGIPVPPIVRRMTGIHNKMLRGQPKISKVMPEFVKFLGDDVLVSHNSIGDMKFLRHFCLETCRKEMKNFFICTHLLSEKLFPDAPEKSLKGLAKHYKLPAPDQLHRAEADAYVTLELFKLIIRKLAKFKRTKIEDVIRFQGDYESGQRLGWAIDPAKLKALPSQPGLFSLHGAGGEKLFLSGALNLQRDVHKLKNHGQLPRPLLRIVLQSYDLHWEQAPCAFQAVVSEYRLPRPGNFAAVNWHQRQIQALYLVPQEEGLRLGIGIPEQGTISAYGPIKDRKQAAELAENIAKVFGVENPRKGAVLPHRADKLLHAFFLRRLLPYAEKRVHERDQWWNALRVGFKREIDDELELLNRMERIDPIPGLSALFEISGALFVPHTQAPAQAPRWHVYIIANALPVSHSSLKEDYLERLANRSYRTRLKDRVKRMMRKAPRYPQSHREMEMALATLWWIFNGRLPGKFYSWEELESSD